MAVRKHPKPEGREIIEWVTARGWTCTVGSKYFVLRCPCGEHQTWLHLTPSNPNYWKNKKAELKRLCQAADELHA